MVKYKAFSIMLLLLIFSAGVASAHEAATFNYIGQIVPTPRMVRYGEEFPVLYPANNPQGHILVLYHEQANPLEKNAAGELVAFLKQLYPAARERIALASSYPEKPTEDLALIIALGLASQALLPATEQLKDCPKEAIPAHPEGYLLITQPGAPALALAAAQEPLGVFYATRSLMQLFHLRDDILYLREAETRDWPAYRVRVSGNDEAVPSGKVPTEAVDWLALFKMNGWAVGQSYRWPENWRKMPDRETYALHRAYRVAGDGRLSLILQVHPFGRANDPERRYTINMTDPADREILYQLCHENLLHGARDIMIRADDFYQLTDRDRKAFPSMAHAHTDMLNELYRRLSHDFPGMRLYFCPPYYHGQAMESEPASTYMAYLSKKLEQSVRLVWTGPEIISRQFSMEDAEKIQQALGRAPLLWDNTVFAVENRFGYLYRFAYYLFHPFKPAMPAGYHRHSEGVRFNYGYDGSEIAKIANIVLADYLWNPMDYDPEESLRRAMGMVAHPDAVDTLWELSHGLRLVFELAHAPAHLLSAERPPTEMRFRELLGQLKTHTNNQRLHADISEQFVNRLADIRALEKTSVLAGRLEKEALKVITAESSCWRTSISGDWQAVRDNHVLRFTFPFETPSSAGAHAYLVCNLQVPASPTGRYYLHFLADDDYHPAGEPPRTWPGYLFREIAVNNQNVWEEDVTVPAEFAFHEVELTDLLRGVSLVRFHVGASDRRGVHNLGINTSFSRFFLSPRSLKEIGTPAVPDHANNEKE